MKRNFDFIVSLIFLILLFPFAILISFAIMIESKGGIFFLQERVGQSAKPFQMYKFRSMVAGADQQGPYFTAQGDPRVTRVGAFLRKTSLDELPQLLNVLKGDMSLVGPRPDVFAQRSNYTQEEWDKRTCVKPGITGLAQATIRNVGGPGQRTALDLEYVDKSSFWLDLKILLLTVKQVLFKGSH
ncbi:MAG: sugar transferase [Nitrospinota bacterium]|nr:sugar transferase [Nitrospinota bacterium]